MSEANNFSRPIENPGVKQSEKQQEVVGIQETSPVIEEPKTPLTINEKVAQLVADTELIGTEESIVSLFEGQDEAIQSQAYTELERAKKYGVLPKAIETFGFDLASGLDGVKKLNDDSAKEQIIQPFEEKMTTLFSEIGINYTRDITHQEILAKLPDLTPEQLEKFQKLLTELSSQSSIDNYTKNNLGKMIAQISDGVIPNEIQNNEVQIQNNEVQIQNNEVQIQNNEVQIKNALDRAKELGEERSKDIIRMILKHSNISIEEYNKLSTNDEKELKIIEALTKIKPDNTQAIEDILMVVAQADPKGVEGETFKAFYAVFETSGVAPDVLVRITNKIEKSSLSKDQQKAYFTGVTSEPTEDEKGFLTYENQKIDLSEIPPVRYIKTQGNLEIKSTDKEYYTALREKNQKEHISENLKSEIAQLELDSQNNKDEGVKMFNLLKEHKKELKQLNEKSGNSFEEIDKLADLEGEINRLDQELKILEIKQQKIESDLKEKRKQQESLKGDIKILEVILTDRKEFLDTQKKKTQDTVNFLDNIGFTHIQKDDIDWIVTQVNSFDATYYGFSQPLSFENGFDYQTNKGYQEFMKFFDTLIYGKNPKDMKKGVTGTDQNTFIDGRDKSRSNVSFRNDLITQGVLREDGRLNQFNFFQKFSSRNAEKQPTANAPKEGSEAKQ